MCTWIAKKWLLVFNLLIALLGTLCLIFSIIVLSRARTDFGAALIVVSCYVLFVGIFGLLVAMRHPALMKIWTGLTALMILFEAIVVLAFVFDKQSFLRFINRIDQDVPWNTNSSTNSSRTQTAADWLSAHSEEIRWPALIFLIFEVFTISFAAFCAKRLADRPEEEDKEYLLAYSQLHDKVRSHPVTDERRAALNEKCVFSRLSFTNRVLILLPTDGGAFAKKSSTTRVELSSSS